MKGLTARQRQILEYIRRYRRRYGRSPSLREIARALGLRSHTTVYRHLLRIQKKGFLEWQGHKALPVDACTDCIRIPVFTLQGLLPYAQGTPVRYVEIPRWMLAPVAEPQGLFALPASAVGLPEGLLVLEPNPQDFQPGDWALGYTPETGILLYPLRQQGHRWFLEDPQGHKIPLDRSDSRPVLLGRVVAALLNRLPQGP